MDSIKSVIYGLLLSLMTIVGVGLLLLSSLGGAYPLQTACLGGCIIYGVFWVVDFLNKQLLITSIIIFITVLTYVFLVLIL